MEGKGGAMEFICPSIAGYLRRELGKDPDEDVSWARNVDLLNFSSSDGVNNFSAIQFALPNGAPAAARVFVPREARLLADGRAMLEYVRRAAQWVAGLWWSEPIAGLTISVWLTPIKKTWCSEGGGKGGRSSRLGRCEVNSGETRFARDGSRHISVWRAEDWSKVVLHELFHAFGWDRLVPEEQRRNGSNPSEALVEAMAILAHCQLLGGPRQWREFFDRELRWSLGIAARLRALPWQPQGTSVHSYYVLKCALILSLPLFAAWLRRPAAIASSNTPSIKAQDSAVQMARASWPSLASQALQALQTRLAAPAAPLTDRCTSMRMAYHQLSLAPQLHQ
jgi:hypothetical protein